MGSYLLGRRRWRRTGVFPLLPGFHGLFGFDREVAVLRP
jgi:hypothetical protein